MRSAKILKLFYKISIFHVSAAGRVTLIKSTSTSIPIHAMQTTLLPQKISQHLDTLICRFLWGDTTCHRHCHTISSKVIITTLKDVGGLGIKSSLHMKWLCSWIKPVGFSNGQPHYGHKFWKPNTFPTRTFLRVSLVPEHLISKKLYI